MPNPTVKYSNGFDLLKVEDALVGLVGWKQPTVSSAPTLSNANKESRSGRYFNDGSFHAIVTPNIIKSSQEDSGISNDDFNTLLLDRQKAAIQRALTGVFNQPELIEHVLLYDRDDNIDDTTITSEGKFVGYEIEISKNPNTTIQFNTATLLFDQDVTFTLYLFKDGKKTSVWSQEVSAIAYEATVVDLTDLYLNYVGNTKGSKFWFGYFQDDLNSAKAIREEAEFNSTIGFSAEPVFVDVSGNYLVPRSYTYSAYPFGLNIEATSFKDHTQAIVQKSYLFTELIGLTMAAMVIEEALYSLRTNKEERILKDNLQQIGIQFDLNGTVPAENAPQILGLKQRIDRELKRVKEQFYPKKRSQVINLA